MPSLFYQDSNRQHNCLLFFEVLLCPVWIHSTQSRVRHVDCSKSLWWDSCVDYAQALSAATESCVIVAQISPWSFLWTSCATVTKHLWVSTVHTTWWLLGKTWWKGVESDLWLTSLFPTAIGTQKCLQLVGELYISLGHITSFLPKPHCFHLCNEIPQRPFWFFPGLKEHGDIFLVV